MSVLFYPESIRILGSDANGNNVMLCEMAVDDIVNLPAANAFISDGYVLSMGCTAIAINDNSKHRLNGGGNWVQIAAGTSTYTRAEIDTMISAIDVENANQQTEINYSINTGAKNLFDIQHPSTVRDTGYNATSNGGVELTCSNAVWTQYVISDISVKSGSEFDFTLYVDAISGTNTFRVYIRDGNSSGNILFDSGNISAVQTITHTITSNSGNIWVGIYLNNSATPKTASAKIRGMIRPAAITDSTFEPYSPTNRQLYEMILQLQGG